MLNWQNDWRSLFATSLALIFTCNVSFASDIFFWSGTFGGSGSEMAHSMRLTPDGGFITAGFTGSKDGDVRTRIPGNNMLVVKYDVTGKAEWYQVFGGPQNDCAYEIELTHTGGYIVAGSTEYNSKVPHYKSNNDIWLVNMDARGQIQWQRCYGGNGNDIPTSIRATGEGGFVVSGFTDSVTGDISNPLGGLDGWVFRINSAGEIIWETTVGTERDDQLFDIRPTSDGGFVAVGRTCSNSGQIKDEWGLGNLYVVKLSQTGDVQWEKQYGGVDEDRGNSVIEASDGGYIIAGMTKSYTGDLDGDQHLPELSPPYSGAANAWVVKLGSNGELMWHRTYGGSGSEAAYSISQTDDGGYIVVGETESFAFAGDTAGTHGRKDLWLFRLDMAGVRRWQRSLGARFNDIGFDVRQTPDGSFIVVGTATPSGGGMVAEGHAGYDFWTFRISDY